MMMCDTPQKIRDSLEGELLIVRLDDWQKANGLIETLPGVLEVQTYGESLHILVDEAKKRLPEIEKALTKHKISYQEARIASPRMEEAFISLIKRMED